MRKIISLLVLTLLPSPLLAYEIEHASFTDHLAPEQTSYRFVSDVKKDKKRHFLVVQADKKRSFFVLSEAELQGAVNSLLVWYSRELQVQKVGPNGKACNDDLRLKARFSQYMSVPLCEGNYRHLALEVKTKSLVKSFQKKPVVAKL